MRIDKVELDNKVMYVITDFTLDIPNLVFNLNLFSTINNYFFESVLGKNAYNSSQFFLKQKIWTIQFQHSSNIQGLIFNIANILNLPNLSAELLISQLSTTDYENEINCDIQQLPTNGVNHRDTQLIGR